MSVQLWCDDSRHLALEVARGEKTVAFVALDNGSISLQRQDKTDFRTRFHLEPPTGRADIKPTPRHYARVMLGSAGKTWPISQDAVQILLRELALDTDEERPITPVILAERSGKLIGCFEKEADAMLAKQYYPEAIIARSARDLTEWPAGQLDALRQQVAPSLKTKVHHKLAEGVFAMAIAAPRAEAPTPRKVEKTTKERAPKADGPIERIRRYVAENERRFTSHDLTKKAAVVELKKLGLHAGTIGVQLSRWLKEMKIDHVSGSKSAKGNGAAEPKATKSAKAPKAAKPVKEPKAAKAPKAATKEPKAAKKAKTAN